MIDVSTLAGWVGAVTTALSPLVTRIEAHVRGAERLHLDDTPVPVLAKGKTCTGRLWTVVRDDRPFGGPEPPAVAYFYSPDRCGAHAETWLGDFHGIVQADAFSGFGRLYEPGRKPGPLREAACWVQACGDLWNLFPASRRVNQHEKRDRLPSAAALARARELILTWWRTAWDTDAALADRFWAEARAALPMAAYTSYEAAFSGLEWRRLPVSQDQQPPEWSGRATAVP